MAPNRLKRNLAILEVLSKAPKKQREAIINTATKDQILCLCDCANNILLENINLSPTEIEKLRRYQHLVRYLAENKNKRKLKKNKDYLVQSGGFLPVLLAPILGAVGSILAETLVNRK
jgi:hypothetical protein